MGALLSNAPSGIYQLQNFIEGSFHVAVFTFFGRVLSALAADTPARRPMLPGGRIRPLAVHDARVGAYVDGWRCAYSMRFNPVWDKHQISCGRASKGKV